MLTATSMQQQDIRDVIFAEIKEKNFSAHLIAERAGVLSGVSRLKAFLSENRIAADVRVADGGVVAAGEIIAVLTGTPKQLAVAEEFVIGFLAKPSGIATAARQAVAKAGPTMSVACGAWKKMPPELKHIVREAVAAGGASFRITDQPFLYLDKNFVRMLGGIEATLSVVAGINDKQKAIQVKGESGNIEDEALAAVRGGAHIIMIDTGRLEDVAAVNRVLAEVGQRAAVKIAFAKGVKVEALPSFIGLGIDIIDIGASIIDAPLLDMKLDVQR